MERKFMATVRQEGDWYVARAAEVDVASQGDTEEEAFANLREALELRFEQETLVLKRSCEDVFGEFQGQLVFLEDPDAPTIDEWLEV